MGLQWFDDGGCVAVRLPFGSGLHDGNGVRGFVLRVGGVGL